MIAELEGENSSLQDRVEDLLATSRSAPARDRLKRLLAQIEAAGSSISVMTRAPAGGSLRGDALNGVLAGFRESIQNYTNRAKSLRARAETRLDELALNYVDSQDHRMAYALDKTEQQIAHLYEYLALENLGEGRK